jgi:Family of unknown function (DUF6941)
VLGIWRHVAVSQFPALHPRAHLVLRMRGRRTEIGSHELRVRLTAPDQAVVLEHSGTMQVHEPPAGIIELEAPAILVLDLPLSRPGEYAFVISLGGVESTRLTFHASQVTPPPGGTLH